MHKHPSKRVYALPLDCSEVEVKGCEAQGVGVVLGPSRRGGKEATPKVASSFSLEREPGLMETLG